MKIEVGMYVRTKDGIFKIYAIAPKEEDYYKLILEENDSLSIGDSEFITKASNNIIDLIEVNDIVQIKESIDNYSKSYFIGIDEMATLRTMKERIENGNLILESILTKESFENNCYKIGDENNDLDI